MKSYYDVHAARFAAEALAADLSGVYGPFLERIPGNGLILDAGCGPGRDAKVFLARGYRVEAFDRSPAMVRRAREYAGLAVKRASFESLAAVARYDGVWCCASLLHVGKSRERRVFRRIARALKPGGVWYLSYKLGATQRRDGGRLFNDHDPDTLARALKGAPGLETVRLWVTEDRRKGRWLNGLVRRVTSPA